VLRKDPDPEPDGSTSFWDAGSGSAAMPKARSGSGFAEKKEKTGAMKVTISNGKTSLVHYRTLSFFACRF
jgi:hypothetical protein